MGGRAWARILSDTGARGETGRRIGWARASRCAAEACGREQEAANRGRATRRAVLAGPGPRVIA